MATTRLHLRDLSPHTVTRSRGYAAYEELKRHLGLNQMVEVDISGEYPISLSFLDGLVLRLMTSGGLDQITFVVHNQDVLRKLERIAEIRQVDISYLDIDTKVRAKVKRLSPLKSETTVLSTKPTTG